MRSRREVMLHIRAWLPTLGLDEPEHQRARRITTNMLRNRKCYAKNSSPYYMGRVNELLFILRADPQNETAVYLAELFDEAIHTWRNSSVFGSGRKTRFRPRQDGEGNHLVILGPDEFLRWEHFRSKRRPTGRGRSRPTHPPFRPVRHLPRMSS